MKHPNIVRFLCLAFCLCMTALIFGGCAAVNEDRIDDASTDQSMQESDEAQETDTDVSFDLEQSVTPSAEELRAQKRVITGKDMGFHAGMDWGETDDLGWSNVPRIAEPTYWAIDAYGDDVLYRVTFIIGGQYSDCDLRGDAMIAERYAYLDSLGIPFQELKRKYDIAWCSADLSYSEMQKLGSFGGINNFRLFLDEKTVDDGIIPD